MGKTAVAATFLVVFVALVMHDGGTHATTDSHQRTPWSSGGERITEDYTQEGDGSADDQTPTIPLFKVDPGSVTWDNVSAHLANPKTQPLLDSALDALRVCFEQVVLPGKYVKPAFTKRTSERDDWSTFQFTSLSRRKEEALQELATVIREVDNLFHSSCPKIVKSQAPQIMSRRDFKNYAYQLMKVGVHKALVDAVPALEEWQYDDIIVPSLFGAMSDIRKNPKSLRRLDTALRNPAFMAAKTEKLAPVLESWVTADFYLLQRLNQARLDINKLNFLRQRIQMKGRAIFVILLGAQYPRIAKMVEQATTMVYSSLLGSPVTEGEEGEEMDPGQHIRVNETLLCRQSDTASNIFTGRRLSFLKRWIYASKYRAVSVSSQIQESTPLTKFLARKMMHGGPPPTEEQIDGLAVEIERVRPDCFYNEKDVPVGRPVVRVKASLMKTFIKLLKDWESGKGESQHFYKIQQRRNDVVPASVRGTLFKAGIKQFAKGLGLGLLLVGGIGVAFFLLVCIAGFAVTANVPGSLACITGASVAGGTAMFVISPGLAASTVGLGGMTSFLTWKWRVSSALATAIRETTLLSLPTYHGVISGKPEE